MSTGHAVMAYAREPEQDWDDLGSNREWRAVVGTNTRAHWPEMDPEVRSSIALDAMALVASRTATAPTEPWPLQLARKGYRRLVGLRQPRRDYPFRDHEQLITLKARKYGVRTILDVGANEGQFARGIRELGWDSAIVSFEPGREAHRALLELSANDADWTVAERMAIGSEDGEATLNLAANSVSSSLLPVHQRSIDVIEATRYVATEQVRVRSLDDVVDGSFQAPFALKIDTQGFEMEVLRGASKTLRNTSVLVIEMSLFPLYEGAASFADLYRMVEDAGFRCIALTEAFVDFPKNEILQVDGTFIRI